MLTPSPPGAGGCDDRSWGGLHNPRFFSPFLFCVFIKTTIFLCAARSRSKVSPQGSPLWLAPVAADHIHRSHGIIIITIMRFDEHHIVLGERREDQHTFEGSTILIMTSLSLSSSDPSGLSSKACAWCRRPDVGDFRC